MSPDDCRADAAERPSRATRVAAPAAPGAATPCPKSARLAPVPASLAAAVLQACGGGGGDGTGGTGGTAPLAAGGGAVAGPGAAIPAGSAKPATDAEAARFLLQAQFSASPEDIASVRALGYAGWLSARFAAAPGQTGWDWLDERGYASNSPTTAYYDNTYPAHFMIWKQLVTAPDALRQRIAFALSEIFVVAINGLDARWRSHLVASWWDMLAGNALGNFRKLLEDVTLHPAMGVYLNVRGSQKENPATGRQPDENYAREVMQLMTIGLAQLDPDGTPRRGADGAPLESYTPADVSNLARVFTGYDFDLGGGGTDSILGSPAHARRPMAFKAALHSTLDATFLGTTVAGGGNGVDSRTRALDVLFQHPNVGPFIARQLIQRLVTSNPSPAYVARVAAFFADDGRGVRGSLSATVAAVLLDAEARDAPVPGTAGQGRLREPVLRFVQWARTFGLRSAQGSWKINDLSNPATQLGQSPLNPASVFNFFRPGYVPPNTAIATAGDVAPEFQLVNETSVSGYLNFMQGVIRNGIYVNGADVPQAGGGTVNGFDLTASYARERELVTDAAALVAHLNLLLAAGQIAEGTVREMVAALNATPLTAASAEGARLDRIAAAVLMVMASPEYLVQK
jgi:uncharacterized protein (DUF1800 family)